MNLFELQELIDEIKVGKSVVDAAQNARDAAQSELEAVEGKFRDLVNKLLEHAIAPVQTTPDS